MPIIDLTRQTNLTVDAAKTLDVSGIVDIVKDGLQIASVAVTTTAAELNILDGAILDTTELNYVNGVTSSIQTQLNNILDGTSDFIGNVDIGSIATPQDLVVWGDFSVMGSGIIFDTETIQVEDPIMQLNYISGAPQDGVNGGIRIGRSSTDDAQMIWNETTDRWQIGVVGSMTNVVGVATTDILENKSITYTAGSNTINHGIIDKNRVLSSNADLTTSLDLLDTEWFNLATSGSAKGANMVNIEDAGGNTSQTTVEAALAELFETNWTFTAGLGLYGNASGQIKDGLAFTFDIEDGTYTTVTSSGLDVDTVALYSHLDDQAMTWTSSQTLNAGGIVPAGQDITLNDAPVADTDATNKLYVDTNAGLWANYLKNEIGEYTTTTTATVLLNNLKVGQEWTAHDFLVCINGQAIQEGNISSIANDGNNVLITFNGLTYNLEDGDEILLWGPLQTAP